MPKRNKAINKNLDQPKSHPYSTRNKPVDDLIKHLGPISPIEEEALEGLSLLGLQNPPDLVASGSGQTSAEVGTSAIESRDDESSINFSSNISASTPKISGSIDQTLSDSQSSDSEGTFTNTIPSVIESNKLPSLPKFLSDKTVSPLIAPIFKNPEMATTIREALGALQADVRVPKFESPFIFLPESGKAETFLQNYNRCSDNNGWRDEHRICFFENYLSGIAIKWYRDYKKDNPNNKWDDIKTAFLKEFGNPNHSREIRFALLNKKQQAEENIKVYLYGILELCNQLETFPSDEAIIEYFEMGIHQSYLTQYHLLSIPEMTLEQLKTVVNKLNNIRANTSAAHMLNPLTATQAQGCNTLNNPNNLNIPKLKSITDSRGEREINRQNKPKCLYCGRLGHYASECYSNPFSKNNKPSQSNNRRYGSNYQHRQGDSNFNQNFRQNQGGNLHNPGGNSRNQTNQGNRASWWNNKPRGAGQSSNFRQQTDNRWFSNSNNNNSKNNRSL